MKKADLIITIIGFLGLIILSLMTIFDSEATNIMSVVIVQLLFASLLIAGYISYSNKRN